MQRESGDQVPEGAIPADPGNHIAAVGCRPVGDEVGIAHRRDIGHTQTARILRRARQAIAIERVELDEAVRIIARCLADRDDPGHVVCQVGIGIGVGPQDRERGRRPKLERSFEAARFGRAAIHRDPGRAIKSGRVHLDALPFHVEHVEVERQRIVEQLGADAQLDVLGGIGAVLQFVGQGTDDLLTRLDVGRARRNPVRSTETIAFAVGRIDHHIGAEFVGGVELPHPAIVARITAVDGKIVRAQRIAEHRQCSGASDA